MNELMKILLVEDNLGDARLLREALLEVDAGAEFDVTHVGRLGDALEQLDGGSFDVVLLDLLLPDAEGLDALIRTNRQSPGVPIVVLSGFNDEELAVAAVQAGAQDYLIKGQADGQLLVRAMRYSIERKRTQTKLAEVYAQVERSRDDMLSILNQLRTGTAMTDEEGRITFLSEAAQQLLGTSQEGNHWEEVFSFHEKEKTRLKEMSERAPGLRQRVPAHTEISGGRRYWMEVDVQDDPREERRKIFFLYDVSEVHNLRRLLDEKAQFHDLIGKSEPMERVYQQIREVARVDLTVLIEGETGTGKELVARAIHASSHRRDKPFVAVNCAGLIDSLLGSQLFGHKRGAFTGAIEDHKGLFEAAHEGTLFLDEIGDIPLNVQTSLLRVLQEREITRLGETRPRQVDVRVLVATHRSLSQEVAKGTFRSDLLYRIRVGRLQLPALRERREDIHLLVGSFLAACRATTGRDVTDVSNEAMRTLLEYSWPGNVRELKSAVELAVIRCKGSVIQPADLPPELLETDYFQALPGDTEQDQKQRLLVALETAKGNRTAAARLLGVSRATFYRHLATFGIAADL